MTEMNLSPQAQSIVTRVKGILLKPKEEWAVINAEPATIQGLFVGYAVLLAAIPAVASLIGSLVFGYGWFGVTYRPPLMNALSVAVGTYILSLVGLAVLALVIEFLAPQFGGEKNRIQAFKVATYSGTAAWVAGIFGLLPGISVLTLLGIYSIYLLYVGLPKLMKTPADKALGYTAVTIVAAIVVAFVSSIVLAPVIGLFGAGSALPGSVS